MSISVLRACSFALLSCAALPAFARAQSVVVRHSVVVEVPPLVGVRDSSWSAPREIGGGTQTTWSGEIRGNTASELQVLGPRELDQTTYVRAAGGQWVQLTAGAWNTVVVSPAGRRVVTLDVSVTTPSGVASNVPALRVIVR